MVTSKDDRKQQEEPVDQRNRYFKTVLIVAAIVEAIAISFVFWLKFFR
ncbi:MAG: hypothetical protein AB1489_40225 [Acidobacteriota bacterium]